LRIEKITNMKGGWFVGNFVPAVYQTDKFEVCYKVHAKGEKWDVHYHAQAVEINYLVSGSMKIQDTLLQAGDIFVLERYEIADPEFLEECHLVIVKVPSVPGDKILVN
jgi:mannose-6-phosphate isomerase-like protein (cupin superfamily)